MCGICIQACEKCKVKFVTCPSCGQSTLIRLEYCLLCKEPIPYQAKEARRTEWAKQHPEAQPTS